MQELSAVKYEEKKSRFFAHLYLIDSPGDMPAVIEIHKKLYKKAAHHCSNTSSSETFIKAVSPEFVICSVGINNSFGHPGSETLKTFQRLNVQYLLTYEKGNIRIK